VRVLVGAFGEQRAALDELSTPVSLLDVHLDPGGRVTIPVDRDATAFAVAIAGSGDAGGAAMVHDTAVSFAPDGDAVALVAGAGGLHVVVASGTPIREPVVFGGPFAMGSREAVEDAYARYRRGDMGRLV
jgi:redox-sensitive bicupin YhaK (pirin superfamily)